VLAAGAGSRFGGEPGSKLLAEVEGQPLLERVLAAVRAFRPAATVVVLGHGADRIEQALAWRDEFRVRNHAPEQGLSSSLKVGIDTLRLWPEPLDGVFIVLGDQPLLRAEVMDSLVNAASAALAADVSAPPGTDRPLVVPSYTQSAAANPVLLLRSGWALVDELGGDRGLGPFIARHPERVLRVKLEGEMPDIDTVADLPPEGDPTHEPD
jgi:molybdenum cofactor cytidylyltransferase